MAKKTKTNWQVGTACTVQGSPLTFVVCSISVTDPHYVWVQHNGGPKLLRHVRELTERKYKGVGAL